MPALRLCPGCNQSFSTAHVIAWLVYGTIPVVFGDQGDIAASGPITPTLTIKPGKELMTKSAELVCPKCSFTDEFEAFTIVRMCPLSGEHADTEIMVINLGPVYIHHDVQQLAETVIFAAPLQEDVTAIFAE